VSRNIDLTKKLSDEDREYLVSRARHDDLRYNEALMNGEEFHAYEPSPGLPSQVVVGGDTSPNSRKATVGSRSVEIAAETGAFEIGADDQTVEASQVEADDDSDDNYDDDEVWKYSDLQKECSERDLPATGNREELIARLRSDDAAE